MTHKIATETIVGGIAAAIAGVAIFAEVALNGFTTAAVAAGVKDVSTTLVALIVLVVAVSKLKPKKDVETYESVLKKELDKWVEHSMPLVHHAEDYENGDRYYLITNFDKSFYNDESKKEICERAKVNSGTYNGKFVDLPTRENPSLKFYLNASTFKGRSKVEEEKYDDTLEKLSGIFASCINKNFRDFCFADVRTDKKSIMVNFEKKLESPDDARDLVRLIEYVMTLYIIAA